LMATVPEMQSPIVGPERRRLLTLMFAAARALPWARTSECAAAIAVLDRGGFDVDVALGSVFSGVDAQRPVRSPGDRAWVERGAAPPPPHATMSPDGQVAEASATKSGNTEKAVRRAAQARRTRPLRSAVAMLPPARRHEAATGQLEPGRHPINLSPVGAAAAPAPVVDGPPPENREWWLPATPTEAGAPPIAIATRVETGYGGIFYLLNAWLAMGLYSDFTQPRGPNLAISPWDLLALVGRAWFGAAFVADAVWTLLAALACRNPDEEPGRDADVPDAWLDRHLDTLTARLQSALGCDEPNVPVIVCGHHALIDVTAASVQVFLRLSELPLNVRIAGLDRDPGWIPAAGRSVSFHFA